MLAKTPVTIVTGFLGAGKTTLIRHLLEPCRRTAARADHQRIRRRRRRRRTPAGLRRRGLPREDESSNSPTAASAAPSPTISRRRSTALLAREPRPDHIVIETSGLALPKPLVKAFDWPELRARLTVDGVVAVVDARRRRRGPLRRRSRAASPRSAPPTRRSITTIRSRKSTRTSCSAPISSCSTRPISSRRKRWTRLRAEIAAPCRAR